MSLKWIIPYKKIIDAYKGQIWVEDRVKGDHRKGSNFIVLIPEVK